MVMCWCSIWCIGVIMGLKSGAELWGDVCTCAILVSGLVEGMGVEAGVCGEVGLGVSSGR